MNTKEDQINDFFRKQPSLFQQYSRVSENNEDYMVEPPQLVKIPSGSFNYYLPRQQSFDYDNMMMMRIPSMMNGLALQTQQSMNMMMPTMPEPDLVKQEESQKLRKTARVTKTIEKQQVEPIKTQNRRQKKKKDDNHLEAQPCNCANSNCLKRYCRCFHSGRQCVAECQCCDCKNNDDFAQDREEAILHVKTKCHRNKRVPKEKLFELKSTWGCNCKKTNCQKNYCECFLRGKKCTTDCECEGCENGQDEAFAKQNFKQSSRRSRVNQ